MAVKEDNQSDRMVVRKRESKAFQRSYKWLRQLFRLFFFFEMAADLNLTRPKREVTEKKKKTGWCCQTVPWDTRFVYRRKEKKYVKLRFVCATSWSQKSERNQQIKRAQWLLEQNKNDRNGEPMETTRANSNQEKKNSLCICLWNCKSDLLLFFWTKCFRHQKEISKRIWDFEHESTNAKTAAQSVKKKKRRC